MVVKQFIDLRTHKCFIMRWGHLQIQKTLVRDRPFPAHSHTTCSLADSTLLPSTFCFAFIRVLSGDALGPTTPSFFFTNTYFSHTQTSFRFASFTFPSTAIVIDFIITLHWFGDVRIEKELNWTKVVLPILLLEAGLQVKSRRGLQ